MKITLIDLSAANRKEVPSEIAEKLEDAGIMLRIAECHNADDVRIHTQDADIVWALGNGQILSAENIELLGENCFAILRSGSGTDKIAVEEASRLGILVVNTPSALSDEVANHAVALLLAVTRCIALQDKNMRNGIFDRNAGYPEWHYNGKTMGLLGLGQIPRLVRKKLSGFDMDFIAYDPYVKEETFKALDVKSVSFDELLEQSDFLSIHCPLTPQTHQLFSVDTFKRMKKKSVLINTARGEIIDESALFTALKEKWISAAALDVFNEEPTPADNPLLSLDNIVVTPHISSFSDIFIKKLWEYAADSILDMKSGFLPPSYVNAPPNPRKTLIQK